MDAELFFNLNFFEVAWPPCFTMAAPKTCVTLEPLWSEATPSQSPFLIGTLLRVDGACLLLDCGWTEALDAASVLPALRRAAPGLDAVLVSFGDLRHAGSLPLLYRPSSSGGGGCRAPMFVTPPAQIFAQRALFDAFEARRAVEEPGWERDAFSLDDVSATFNMREFGGPMVRVRFTEESAVGDGGVLVTAYAAGHQLGGSMWRVVKGAESIVYAPRVNQKTELHLPKALLSTVLRSPSALLVDGGFAGACLLGGGAGTAAAAAAAGAAWALPKPPPAPPGSRGAGPKEVWQRTLLEACVWTMQQGGSVLLPCDTAGRGLEVLMRLESLYGTLYPWPIYYVGHTAKDVRGGAFLPPLTPARSTPPPPPLFSRPFLPRCNKHARRSSKTRARCWSLWATRPPSPFPSASRSAPSAPTVAAAGGPSLFPSAPIAPALWRSTAPRRRSRRSPRTGPA